jgi:hypothetical protein
MTRQSKAVQKKIIATQFTALHKAGQKGPSRTTPAHGKVKTFRALERLAFEAATLAAEREASSQKTNTRKPAPANGKGSKYAGKKAAA